MTNRVNVLGTVYRIVKKKYKSDPEFEQRGINGYCDWAEKKIVYCDMDTYKGYENESEDARRAEERLAVRHEIVHAFFNESGLMANAHSVNVAFSVDEEMIDFIALQGPKIYKAWSDVGCLP